MTPKQERTDVKGRKIKLWVWEVLSAGCLKGRSRELCKSGAEPGVQDTSSASYCQQNILTFVSGALCYSHFPKATVTIC